jgi:hypothetical protein
MRSRPRAHPETRGEKRKPEAEFETDLIKSFRVPEILTDSDQPFWCNQRCRAAAFPAASQSKCAQRLLAFRGRERGD